MSTSVASRVEVEFLHEEGGVEWVLERIVHAFTYIGILSCVVRMIPTSAIQVSYKAVCE